KKILHIITKSTWGGAQQYVYQLASSLPKNEYVSVVAFGEESGFAKNPKETLREKLEAEGIRTCGISSLGRDIRARRDLFSFFELFKILKKERPDIIHLNSSKAGILGTVTGRFYNLYVFFKPK